MLTSCVPFGAVGIDAFVATAGKHRSGKVPAFLSLTEAFFYLLTSY